MNDDATFFIPLRKLAAWNPFHSLVWYDLEEPITKKEIGYAIKNNLFIKKPHNNENRNTRFLHVNRIAYLVVSGWGGDPIDIDVGAPSLNCYIDWIVLDGNHRLAAAFYRRDKTILANIMGDWEYAEELLGIKVCTI